jgi:competence protein ComEA
MRLFVAVLFVSFIGSALSQTRNSDSVDAATFRAICGSCHSTTLVDGLRTEAEWRDEVDQMIKIGARGTEEQFQRVMRVLVRTLTKVNVNTAEPRQIAPVLDVTDAVAEALVKRRASNGNFKTIEDLKQVPGVDPVKLEARKDRIIF